MAKQLPLVDGLYATVDDADFEFLSRLPWKVTLNKSGRAYAVLMISMHRLIMGLPEGRQVDHKNGDSLDNRRENLRVCTRSQNMANIKGPRKGSYKGVRKVPLNRGQGEPLYEACITRQKLDVNGKPIRFPSGSIKRENIILGRFETAEDAARAYDAAAREMWGEFAWLNFPGYKAAPPKPTTAVNRRREKVKELHYGGDSASDIAAKLSIHVAAVHWHLKAIRESGPCPEGCGCADSQTRRRRKDIRDLVRPWAQKGYGSRKIANILNIARSSAKMHLKAIREGL